MPELPEVETIRRELADFVVGKRISRIEVFSAKQFIGAQKDILGAKVRKIWRRAKLLGFSLDNGKTILVHLKLTGQLVFVPSSNGEVIMPRALPFADNKLPNKTTRLIIYFSPSGRLFFNDLRKFGWMKVVASSDLEKETLEYGPEPLDKDFTVAYLRKIFAKTGRAIKVVLMDQKKIAGLGNIYANEALFAARIDPRRSANSLKEKEIACLHQAIRKIIKEAIEEKGTSAADDAYIQANAQPGGYQKKLKVYQREGKPCFRCKGKVVRIKLGGRSAYFCPGCQK